MADESIWNREEPQPIAVPLFNATPSQSDYEFVGRDPLIKELVATLKQTRRSKGCYLISGFRGSGKTTLIDRVLERYKSHTDGPAWLRLDEETIESYSLCKLISRAREKLGLTALPQLNIVYHAMQTWRLYTPLLSRRFRSPRLVKVQINLGQDQALSARGVMFNTASLLHHKLTELHSHTGLWACASTALLLAAIISYMLLEFADVNVVAATIMSFFNSDLSGFSPWQTSTIATSVTLSGLLASAASYALWTRYFSTVARVIFLLEKLIGRMTYTIEIERGINKGAFSRKQTVTMPPMDAREIETELLYILEQARQTKSPAGYLDIVFVYDELDKIAHHGVRGTNDSTASPSVERDLHERKRVVDDLLGALKNFITHGKARFFFIAGREMLDGYQAERGSTSSLYESLFTRIFEVPSLLTDASDHNQQRIHSLLEIYLCRRLMDPDIALYLWLLYTNRHSADDPSWQTDLKRKLTYSPFCLRTYYHYLITVEPKIEGVEARRIVLGLRNFVQFLTLHSWGNPKRMISLFDHFTKSITSVDWRQKENVKRISESYHDVSTALQFGLIDQQRILLASNLYTQLYHDLGRQLANSGDKLAVSTLAAFQHILKFHRHPFSRYHLERMSETVSVYRSPELNTIIDTLLSKVFHPHIRRIRNSHYRYRFNGDFEQELRYISRVSDIESAAFNFSLDATAPIKAHYIDQLRDLTAQRADSAESEVSIHMLCMVIGDLYELEQSHDKAFTYYQMAVDLFDKCAPERRSRFAHFYVEALLRLGETYERCHRYDRAASVYGHAQIAVKNLVGATGSGFADALRTGDSKWDVFRQPFWAYWYLQLKRSPVPSRNKLPPPFEFPFDNPNDPVNHYRAGQLAFFYGCHYTAVRSFVEAIKHSGIETAQTERTAYVGAYAYLRLGQNLFVGMMRYLGEIALPGQILPDNNAETLRTLLFNRLPRFNVINNLGALEREFSTNQQAFINQLSQIENKEDLLGRMDILRALSMMAFAARTFADRGLHYHAAGAYLTILATWAMLTDIIFQLTGGIADNNHRGPDNNHRGPAGGTPKLLAREVADVVQRSEKWVAEVRTRAADCIAYMSAGGYSRFQARWKNRDVAPLLAPDNGVQPDHARADKFLSRQWDLLDKKVGTRQRNETDQTRDAAGIELRQTIDILFPISAVRRYRTEASHLKKSMPRRSSKFSYAQAEEVLRSTKLFDHARIKIILEGLPATGCESNGWIDSRDLFKRACIDLRREIARTQQAAVQNAIFTQRSMTGQKLIYLSIWEHMGRMRFRESGEPLVIPHQSMVPHSVRALMFAHWLAARRYLHWRVTNVMDHREPISAERRDTMYDDAAAAVHNFHRAIYYNRQLSGSDQDLMFPDPAMIHYELWRLLYRLVRWESARDPGKAYSSVVEDVKKELSTSTLRHHETPANLYDLNNVTRRTIDMLRDAEQLGDITNRVRSDAIRTRQFLADDYEDPRFHLDWTLVQMYSPVAGILRRHVENVSRRNLDNAYAPPEWPDVDRDVDADSGGIGSATS